MSDGFYLDNDVVLKTCSYGVGACLVELSTAKDLAPAILALARFTLRSRLKRSKVLVDAPSAKAQLDLVLAQARLLEPTPEEVEIAADLEATATKANLSFDTGESLLVAMLMARGGLAFFSGDKRAAKAISVVLPELKKRLVCLEQVLYSIVVKNGLEPLRSSVCREAVVDRAATNSFQCSSQVEAEAVLRALESYSNALRAETGVLVVATAGVSSAEFAQEDSIRGA